MKSTEEEEEEEDTEEACTAAPLWEWVDVVIPVAARWLDRHWNVNTNYKTEKLPLVYRGEELCHVSGKEKWVKQCGSFISNKAAWIVEHLNKR